MVSLIGRFTLEPDYKRTWSALDIYLGVSTEKIVAFKFTSVLHRCLTYIDLIQKRLSSELLHCALRIVAYPDRKAPRM